MTVFCVFVFVCCLYQEDMPVYGVMTFLLDQVCLFTIYIHEHACMHTPQTRDIRIHTHSMLTLEASDVVCWLCIVVLV